MRNPAVVLERRNEYLFELDSLSSTGRKNGLSYASVFCGGGGLDLGFTAAGFKPLFSSDVVNAFCDTVHRNLPKHLVEPHDITTLSGRAVLERVGDHVDVVIGGACPKFCV